MKRRNLIFCILLLTGCTSKKITEVSFDDVNKMIESNESFIYFAGSKTCYNCNVLKRNIKLTSGVHYYYLDIDNNTKEQNESLRQSVTSKLPSYYYTDNLMNSYEIALYTPAILKYVNGELVYTYNMSISKSDIKELYNFNLIDIGYYENYISLDKEKEHYSIVFYNNESKDSIKHIQRLKENLTASNATEYALKYTNLKDHHSSDLIDLYNSNHEDKVNSFDELPSYFEITK